MPDPTVDSFLTKLKDLKEQHVEHLSAGSVATHEEYRHICGVIKGLTMAELELKELMSIVDDF